MAKKVEVKVVEKRKPAPEEKVAKVEKEQKCPVGINPEKD